MCSCVLCWVHGPQRRRGRTARARRAAGRRVGREDRHTPQAPANPSPVMILTRLREAPCTVTDLAESAGMELSAVSHQLRLLRNLGLVTGTRSGKNIVYALYDNHVAALLDQAVYHIEHLRLGIADVPADAASRNPLIHHDPATVTASAG